MTAHILDLVMAGAIGFLPAATSIDRTPAGGREVWENDAATPGQSLSMPSAAPYPPLIVHRAIHHAGVDRQLDVGADAIALCVAIGERGDPT